MAKMRFTKENVLILYKMIMEETGGSFGVRDEGLLESALVAPFQSFDETEAFPGKLEKAARLCCGVVHNHPFVDGNKRMGVLLMLVYLESEKIDISFTQDELVEMGLVVASGTLDYDGLLSWIEKHI